MAEKILSSRIVHKHDVAANWSKATGFTPRAGELIVYDIDADYAYERIKIGDGTRNVNALPFVDDALRAALVELINAVDDKVDAVSTLVGDTSVAEQINTAVANSQSDWSVNDETSPAYVKNRTHWMGDQYKKVLFESQNVAFTYDAEYTVSFTNVDFTENLNIGDQFVFVFDGVEYDITLQNFGSDLIAFGNLSIAEIGDNTGEPFVCVMNMSPNWDIYTNDTSDTTHTIEAYYMAREYHKLDRAYLPDDAILPIVSDYEDGYVLSARSGEWIAERPVGVSNGVGEIFNSYFGSYANEAGLYAHAEGYKTKAIGQSSHTGGIGTIANSLGQYVFGTYNTEDDGEPELPDYPSRGKRKYVHIVGNGESDGSRSNAHTLDWDGNAWFKGAVKIGGTGQDDEVAKELATQNYVDTAIAAIPTPDVSGQIEAHNTSETAHSDIRSSISDLSELVGDTPVSEQIAAANIIHVGPTEPTDPNIQVWINTAEEGTGIIPVLPRIATVTLDASAWHGSSAPYSQVVEINTVTSATKIDLQPTVAQIVALQNDDIALMAENIDGVVTIYSFGGRPSTDMTMQVQLMEVSYV